MIGEQAYQNAMRRRAELRQELDEIETFLRLYERFAAHASGAGQAPSATGEGYATVTPSDSAPASSNSEQAAKHVAGAALVPHIRAAILDVGRPLSRSDVVKVLSDRGVTVGGQDPVTNVGTIIWRAKGDFVNLKRHGYWPRDVAYPPAGYDPTRANNTADEDGLDDNGAKAPRDDDSKATLWSATG